jgi:Protein of unknown function (DUF2815)
MKVKLKNVRLAFPCIFEARAQNPGDKPAFSAVFIFPPEHEATKEIEAAIEQVAKDKWGEKAPAQLKAIRAADKTCLHNGDTKSQLAGYEGNLFINARSYTRPGIFNSDGTPLIEADGKPYAGCFVHAILDVYPQDNSYGKRVNAALSGVMFYRDGEAFSGGGTATAEDFGDLVGEVDMEDLV